MIKRGTKLIFGIVKTDDAETEGTGNPVSTYSPVDAAQTQSNFLA